MREITKSVLQFLLYFIVVLILSALLAPWLFSFLPFKFDRIMRRLIMIGTLFLVFWFMRARKQSLSQLGLAWGGESGPLWGRGFLAGVGMVVLITLVQWALGARFWQPKETDLGHWVGFFFKGFGAGLVIGVIEEFFFRGFLFFTLKELWNTKVSLFVTNLIYALVHFFPKGRSFPGEEPTVMDGFRLLAAILMPQPAQWAAVWPAVLGLFLFGLVLSFVFLRTRSLYPSIGIHAGAVFAMKLNRRFLPDVSEKMNFLSGTKNLYDGIAGLVILGGTALATGWWAGRPPKKRQ